MPTTFNGWPIIPMPSIPAAPASVEFTLMDSVAVSVSPFTGAQQIQNWQSSWLEASVSMPPLTHAQAQAWIAWLMGVQGQANVFQLGDPLARAPLAGVGSGTMAVNGAGQTGYTLSVRDWTGELSPGDWLQVGYRLYRNLGTVSASGGATPLSIWPQIRESPLDGAAITLVNTQGLFRLKSNARKYSITESRMYGLQFEIREAL